MKIIIGCVVVMSLLFVSIMINIIFQISYRKRFINIFDNNVMEKLLSFNYDTLKIKRKLRLITGLTENDNLKEIPLEMEYNHGIFVTINIDFIEVYGIENEKEYLIYKKDWTKENAINIKNVVNAINNKLINTQ